MLFLSFFADFILSAIYSSKGLVNDSAMASDAFSIAVVVKRFAVAVEMANFAV